MGETTATQVSSAAPDVRPAATPGETVAPILVVDDDVNVLALFESVLRNAGYDLTRAESGSEAISALKDREFSLVVTDVLMDGISGLDLLKWVKEHHPDTQVVLVTGRASLDSAIAALRGGAMDYLSKPVDVDRLTTIVRNAVSRYGLQRENRELVAKLEEHQRFLQQRIREATHDLAEANRRLSELAIRDGLTNIYNHRHFQERLDEELKRADRYGRKVSLMMLDLDHFKQFNDTYGHQEGNEALKFVAELLTAHVREVDIVARYGGEEFAAIVPVQGDADDAAIVSERVRHTIESTGLPLQDGQVRHLTVSIGYATYPVDAKTRNDLIECADEALYGAKNAGRNRVVAYEELAKQ